MTLSQLRKNLSRVFDDDLKTIQWKNILDGVIIFFIFLSTLEVFLSTYNGVVENYGGILEVIDIVTTIFFTIEVTLRIWTCGELDEKYIGWRGKLRYCFSFYGLIDILATYPFYVNFFIPVPYTTLKVLRIARILRVFRYMKSFKVLAEAFVSKKKEMWISLQFLCIVTFILSLILYFVEHEAQPEVFDNGATSVVWAFAQYIGDPGGFADFAPVTFMGRIIACLVGVLGIAIFAVPAGLIGSAFIEVIEEHEKEEKIKNDIHKVHSTFRFDRDQHHTNLFYVPRYLPMSTVLTRKFMSENEMLKAVEASDCFHLYNLATSTNKEDKPEDKSVIVNYYHNRPYGCCIDRKSKITIVSTSGFAEPITSWFAFHLAKLGGFNYVAKEVEVDPENPVTYYSINSIDACPNLQTFIDDIDMLSSGEGSWVIQMVMATGPKSRPSQIHFCYNTKKHDSSYDDPLCRIKDYESLEKIYQGMSSVLKEKYGFNSDKNEYYVVDPVKNLGHFLKAENVFVFRVEAYIYTYASYVIEFTKLIADSINKVLRPGVEIPIPPEMLERRAGHDYGFQDYIEPEYKPRKN